MGPYRTNAAPLRARREELRLELDDVEAKMTELSLARHVVERAIDDIDMRLQSDFRPTRGRSPRRLALPLFMAAVAVVATVFMIGFAMTARRHSRCIVTTEPSSIDTREKTSRIDLSPFSDVRRYP